MSKEHDLADKIIPDVIWATVFFVWLATGIGKNLFEISKTILRMNFIYVPMYIY